jgi:DNA polymerase/3'-5' exonuclease PolX
MSQAVMLAKDWEKGMNPPRADMNCLPPLGWLFSEKYDGYRAIWVAEVKKFLSRSDNVFNSVEWFMKAMPPRVKLDGELWVGRENFEAMGVVRKKEPEPEEWCAVKYIVYDLPDHPGPFKDRIKELKKVVSQSRKRWNIIRKDYPEPYCDLECPLVFADQTVIKSQEHMDEMYNSIIKNGGEGGMIKCPNSSYEDGRSNYMLKIKPVFDEEAVIFDYSPGKGKYKGMLGGFVCKPLINMDTYHLIDKDENHEFTVSGMDDEVRENYKITHPIGTVITIEHSGKTNKGKPRFPRYMRVRDDVVLKNEVEDFSTEKRDNLINILSAIGNNEKAKGEAFKANSYFKAVNALKKFEDDSTLTEQNIMAVKGVGKSIYQKIDTILKTGTCLQYDALGEYDDPRIQFMDIHGVGPKKANELVKMGFKTIQHIRDGDAGLNEKQLLGLQYYEEFVQKIPRQEIVKHEEFLKSILKGVDKNAVLTITGSYRRKKEESGDIDVLLKATKKDVFTRYIKKLNDLGYLVDELALGPKKYNGVCVHEKGIARRIDIMYTTPDEYPFAVLYFTGSGDFNKMMRSLILEKGMTINEYSLKDSETKKKVDHVFREEKDIFDYLGMDYVEPEQRL